MAHLLLDSGAAVGSYMFGSLVKVTAYPVIMIICAVVALMGAIISQLFIGLPEEPEDSDGSKLVPNSC